MSEVKNLDELLKVVDKIIEDERIFIMDNFRSKYEYSEETLDDEVVETPFIDKNNCGTAGCLLGWCPVLGSGELEVAAGDYSQLDVLSFDHYCERVFNIDRGVHYRKWDWFFSPLWQNCPKQAKARILFAMKYGVPEVWSGWDDVVYLDETDQLVVNDCFLERRVR